MKRFKVVFFLLLLGVAGTLAAREEVRLGTEAFRKGDYLKASEAFAEAGQRNPNDPRIVYNHGAALAAAGKTDEAVEVLRKTAVSPDKGVAVNSLLLLGGISVEEARQALSQEETPPEQRTKILERLAAAERSYGEVLQIEPDHKTARRNLEELRARRDRVREAWADADRSKHRQGEITDRLRWLENWEGELHDKIRQGDTEADSPKKFQGFYETAKDQGRLAGELGLLQDDLRQYQAEMDARDAGEGESRALEDLVGQLDRLRTAAHGVEEQLGRFQPRQAAEEARKLQEQLNRFRMGLSTFEQIVREAEQRQSQLVDANPESGAEPKDDEARALRDNSAEQVRGEKNVAAWMPLMVYRARQGLQELENQPAPAEPTETEASPEDPRRKSLELAVQYGPEIAELAENAATLLQEGRGADALPDQRRALELLREILRQEQQDPQQQQDQQQDQQQQDQQNQSGQEQEPQNGQEQNDGQQGQGDQDPQPKQGEDEQEQDGEPENAETREKEREVQRAEQLLRQVKRRQQEATERRERVRLLLRQMEPVDKDW